MAKLETNAKLVTLPKGSLVYRYKFEVDGVIYADTTNLTDFDEARAFTVELRRDVIDRNRMRARGMGDLFGESRDNPLSFVAEQFWDLQGKNVVNAKEDKLHLAQIVEMIGEKRMVSRINRLVVQEMIKDFKKVEWKKGRTYRNSCINSRMKLLRRLLTFARTSLELPLKPIEFGKLWLPEEQRTRTLTIAEQERMDDGSDYATVMRFFIICGARKRALLNLRWCDVDLENREIKLRRKLSGKVATKAKDPFYRVHLTDDAVEILRAQLPYKEAGQGQVWTVLSQATRYYDYAKRTFKRGERRPMKVGSFEGWFSRRAARLEPPLDITIHDLRRTCGSEMVRETGSLAFAQVLLDHQDPKVTMQSYVHLLGEDSRRAMARVEEGKKRRKSEERFANFA